MVILYEETTAMYYFLAYTVPILVAVFIILLLYLRYVADDYDDYDLAEKQLEEEDQKIIDTIENNIKVFTNRMKGKDNDNS
jgi:preprotein translocase subunit SecG